MDGIRVSSDNSSSLLPPLSRPSCVQISPRRIHHQRERLSLRAHNTLHRPAERVHNGGDETELVDCAEDSSADLVRDGMQLRRATGTELLGGQSAETVVDGGDGRGGSSVRESSGVAGNVVRDKAVGVLTKV
jgi:hypothetical protein